ncbi:unnamed protein product, partial [Ectocarpus fasciculatus]
MDISRHTQLPQQSPQASKTPTSVVHTALKVIGFEQEKDSMVGIVINYPFDGEQSGDSRSWMATGPSVKKLENSAALQYSNA